MSQPCFQDDARDTETPARPRRRRHLLRWLVVGLLLALVLAGVGGWLAANATPRWYKTLLIPKTDDAENARRVQDTMTAVQAWSDAVYSHEYAKSRRSPRGVPPADQLTIAFTQDQINAFLHKWLSYYGAQQQVDGHTLNELFADPAVRITPTQIIIAGRVKGIADRRVITLHLEPGVTPDGKLQLSVTGISAGLLGVPDAVWAKPRAQLVQTMQNMIPASRRAAEIDAGGASNSPAVAAVLLQVAANSLENKPSGNTLFLPIPAQGGDKAIPVRLKSLSLDEGQITLTVQYLSADERQTLLKEIRQGN